jgi:sulfite exporter TauE/SafE
MPHDYPFALAFLVGLFSTLHCVGMCGNIMGALSLGLPLQVRSTPARHGGYVLTYNLGRLATYALLGAAAGAGGTLLGSRLDPHVWQGVAGLIAALTLILIGLYLSGWAPWVRQVDLLGRGLWRRVEPLGRRLLPVRSPGQALLAGMIWGLLPCGLVYYALLLTVPLADPWQGAAFMAAFGLGTLPSLLATGLVTGWLARVSRRPRSRQFAGAALIALGGSLLLWGQLGMQQHHHPLSLEPETVQLPHHDHR